MECGRCHGLMIAECSKDMGETSGYDWMHAWRCLNCGEVIDPLIAQHRSLAKSGHSCFPQALKNRARPGQVFATRT